MLVDELLGLGRLSTKDDDVEISSCRSREFASMECGSPVHFTPDGEDSLHVDGQKSIIPFLGFRLNPRNVSLLCEEDVWVEVVLDESLLHDLGAELLLRDN